MNLEEKDIIRESFTVKGFDGHESTPCGIFTIPVTLAGKTIRQEVILMNCCSTYNALFGGDWTTAMEATVSCLYQCSKFPYSERTVKV